MNRDKRGAAAAGRRARRRPHRVLHEHVAAGFGPDDKLAPPVVIINEAFARQHFKDSDPLNERLVSAGPRRARRRVAADAERAVRVDPVIALRAE